MTDVNVVLLGEIDSGKSTLINYFANLFENGSLDQLKIAVRDDDNSVTTSRTKICSKYSFVVDQVSLNFFDTPGFSTDEQTIEQIVQCLLKLESLSALIFVLNGSQSRLTTTFRFVLQQLADRIGDIFSSNSIVVFTRCNAHTVNFDATKVFQGSPIFYMQNSAFASDRNTWSRETRRFLQNDWNSSIRTLNQVLETLLQFSPIPTASLKDFTDEQNSFRSFLHQTRLNIEKLAQIEEEFAGMHDTTELNERFQTKKIQVDRPERGAFLHRDISFVLGVRNQRDTVFQHDLFAMQSCLSRTLYVERGKSFTSMPSHEQRPMYNLSATLFARSAFLRSFGDQIG